MFVWLVWRTGLRWPFARAMVGTVAEHRMKLLPPDSGDLVTLHNYRTSGDGAIQGANPGDLRWILPGGTGDLIAGVLTQLKDQLAEPADG